VTAEEEKQEQEEQQQPEEAQEPEAAEEEPAEEPAEDEPAEEAEETPAEASGEDALGPKQRRRLERSRASSPPGPSRTPEERAAERAERHRAAKERRRSYRLGSRRRRDEAGTGTPAAPPDPGSKKVRQGMVVSAGGDKTITVEIAVVRRHPTYEKVVRRTSKLHAHDEGNQAQAGDVVRVIEARPLSRTKRWRLLDILERAR
jgi:small subunit ribosomal protein S17